METTPKAVKSTPIAYSYIRFSATRQGAGDSVRRQTAEADKACAENNWMLDGTLNLRDLGVSGFKGLNATEGRLGAFLKAVKDGLVNQGSVLIVENLDRLSRQKARHAIKIVEEIVDAGVSVYTAMDHQLITAKSIDENPMQLVFAILTFVRANEESEAKSKRGLARWQNARDTARKSGKPLPARTPWWIAKTATGHVLIADRALIVKDSIKSAMAGNGLVKVARQLNADKNTCKGPNGHGWTAGTLAKWFREKTVIGTYQPHASNGKPLGEPIAGFYPAVITEEEYYRLQGAIAQRCTTVRGRTGRSIANLFTGRLFTDSGHAMTIINQNGVRGLVDSSARTGGSSWTAFDYNAFEQAFLTWVKEVNLAPAPTSNKVSAIEANLGMLSERKAKLQDALVSAPDVDMILNAVKEVNEKESALRADLEAERAKVATLPVSTSDIADLYSKLDGMSPDDQEAVRAQLRQAIGQVVHKITIKTARQGRTAVAVVKVEFANHQSRVFCVRTHSRHWQSVAIDARIPADLSIGLDLATLLNADDLRNGAAGAVIVQKNGLPLSPADTFETIIGLGKKAG